MQIHLCTSDVFPGFDAFSADLVEGISMVPQLRLVLTPKEVQRSGPLPALPESAFRQLTQPGVDPWLGQKVEVAFTFKPDSPGTEQCRPPAARDVFQGVVTEYKHDASGAFVVTVRTKLAHCLQSVRSRTFCNKDAGDVIREVLRECEVKYRFSEKLGSRELITQYQESDADFVLRLIAEHQLSYLFAASKGSEELVILRHPRMLQAVTSRPLVVSYPDAKIIDNHIPKLYSWDVSREFRAGRFSDTRPQADKPGRGGTEKTKSSRATPRELAVMHAQTRPTNWEKGQAPGAGSSAQTNPDWDRRYAEGGGTLFLRPADCLYEPGSDTCSPDNLFVVHEVRHSLQEGIRGHDAGYFNSFKARPDGLVWNAPAPRPRIHGVQYATVVAKDGTASAAGTIDLHEDKVWLQFPWDSSDRPRVPVRLAPGLARSFGPLHVGQRVTVEFEDGNPDRPVIVGLAPAHEPKKQPHDVKAHPAVFTMRIPPPVATDNQKDDVVFQADTAKGQARVVAYSPGSLFALARKLLGVESLGTLFLRAGKWLTLQGDDHVVISAGKSITIVVGKCRIVLDGENLAIYAPGTIFIGDGGPDAKEPPKSGDDGMPR